MYTELTAFCHYCDSLVNADDTRLTTDDELMCRECEFGFTDQDSTERR